MRSITITILFLFSILSNAFSQDYSTQAEIYDYEIGDIFHFSEWGSAGSSGYSRMENIEVVNKTFSTDSNSVTYNLFIQQGTHLSEYPHYTFEEFYDNVTYIDLGNIFIADSIYSNTNYNYRKQSYYDISQPPHLTQYGHYVDGCGQAYQYRYQIDPPFMSTWERELVYYKKGIEEWGSPHIVVGAEELKGIEISISCHPNPFTTSTILSYFLSKPSSIIICIFNPQGQLIEKLEQEQPKGEQQVQWNAEGLPAGIYYFRIQAGDKVGGGKMVKME